MALPPVDLLVQALSRLPDAVRPGLFLAAILIAVWFVLWQGGIAVAWHGSCRAVARVLDTLVGVALIPDYLITSARRREGAGPGPRTLAVGHVAENVLETVGA